MSWIIRMIGSCTAAAALCLFVPLLGTPSAEAAERWTCPSGVDANRWDPSTFSRTAHTTLFGRTIELRRSSSAGCSWGRITSGSPGDSVWVDWSDTAGRTWRQLSVTRIPSRGTQAYTSAYRSNGYTMRACGKAGNRPDVVCTGWVS